MTVSQSLVVALLVGR